MGKNYLANTGKKVVEKLGLPNPEVYWPSEDLVPVPPRVLW